MKDCTADRSQRLASPAAVIAMKPVQHRGSAIPPPVKQLDAAVGAVGLVEISEDRHQNGGVRRHATPGQETR
jgi:hypothetical protein